MNAAGAPNALQAAGCECDASLILQAALLDHYTVALGTAQGIIWQATI
jgi:hypothetical protein